jgi:hypothetical protein
VPTPRGQVNLAVLVAGVALLLILALVGASVAPLYHRCRRMDKAGRTVAPGPAAAPYSMSFAEYEAQVTAE